MNSVGRQSDQPIRFAGSVLGAKRHICAFFLGITKRCRFLRLVKTRHSPFTVCSVRQCLLSANGPAKL